MVKSTLRSVWKEQRDVFLQQQVKPSAKWKWKVLDPFMFLTCVISLCGVWSVSTKLFSFLCNRHFLTLEAKWRQEVTLNDFSIQKSCNFNYCWYLVNSSNTQAFHKRINCSIGVTTFSFSFSLVVNFYLFLCLHKVYLWKSKITIITFCANWANITA